jgi:hypothetical protein
MRPDIDYGREVRLVLGSSFNFDGKANRSEAEMLSGMWRFDLVLCPK